MASIGEHYCGKPFVWGWGSVGIKSVAKERDSRKDCRALSRRTGGSMELVLDTQDWQLDGCLLHGLGRTAVVGW